MGASYDHINIRVLDNICILFYLYYYVQSFKVAQNLDSFLYFVAGICWDGVWVLQFLGSSHKHRLLADLFFAYMLSLLVLNSEILTVTIEENAVLF